jgi:hypothetical protein
MELPLLVKRLQVGLVGFKSTRPTLQGELLTKRRIDKRARLSPQERKHEPLTRNQGKIA